MPSRRGPPVLPSATRRRRGHRAEARGRPAPVTTVRRERSQSRPPQPGGCQRHRDRHPRRHAESDSERRRQSRDRSSSHAIGMRIIAAALTAKPIAASVAPAPPLPTRDRMDVAHPLARTISIPKTTPPSTAPTTAMGGSGTTSHPSDASALTAKSWTAKATRYARRFRPGGRPEARAAPSACRNHRGAGPRPEGANDQTGEDPHAAE